jgi:hypothetical protein
MAYNVSRLCAGGALKHGSFNPPLNLTKEQMMNIADNPHLHKTAVSTSYYLVRYCGGSYDDYYSAVIFVTNKKSTATKYVTKFNYILKKWKKHYEQFETDKFGMKWIADEHVEKHFDRWHSLQNITKCYYEEVSFR